MVESTTRSAILAARLQRTGEWYFDPARSSDRPDFRSRRGWRDTPEL